MLGHAAVLLPPARSVWQQQVTRHRLAWSTLFPSRLVSSRLVLVSSSGRRQDRPDSKHVAQEALVFCLLAIVVVVVFIISLSSSLSASLLVLLIAAAPSLLPVSPSP
ncbi:hypothetical protein A7C99_5034 [Trichophyton rubrum]|uniref:Uncharacterized protein n=1 Tax=Trichophyton rubrum TaxID=5551 RepID=A0A178ERI1_TRIRU|nr:hypothetical protein A7C99_5034 [Trichophyton rubrum]